MTTQFRSSAHHLVILIGLFSLSASVANAASAKQQCAPTANAQSEVVRIVTQMFIALRSDDLPALVAVTTPDFYAYDGGRRFTAQTLVELIKKLHAAGKHYEWNVTDPEVHVACNLAWIAYVNRGSIEDAAAGRQDATWLESVILEYANGQWRARFLHSTRVPNAQ